jgi:curved DNA-binding protein CbpA
VTYYQLLGVPQTATLDQLHGAYRSAVRRFHPDVNKAPNAAQVTAKLNEAWHVLGDARSRAAYDRSITRPQPRPAPPTSRRPPPSYGSSADAQGPAYGSTTHPGSGPSGNAGYGTPGSAGYGSPGGAGYGQQGFGPQANWGWGPGYSGQQWSGYGAQGQQYTQHQRQQYGPTVADQSFRPPRVGFGTIRIIVAVAFIASVVHWFPLILTIGAGIVLARVFARTFR